MHERRKGVLLTVIIICALIAFGACGFLINKTVSSNLSEQEYQNIAGSFASEMDETTDLSEKATEALADNPVNLEELSKQNSDIYAWIRVPDTNIDYPVAQNAENENYYLDHDIYKNYSFPGTIYSQPCNSLSFNDRVTVLYGHNMLNGSMFANLHKFSDETFFDEHPYFYIYTLDRKLTYEVVTAFSYDDKHIIYSYDFTDDAVFQNWIDQAKNPRSLNCHVRDSISLDLNSKFVVLSTCLNSDSGRYLVQGVLVKDERTK